ncbi:histidine phosphatase family protein [Elioraea sp.]|uniref:histidine phosphatase family protein n=1 Tax=Elioraea sp. TaxID=2185103 RepID=UPI0025B9AF5C|nr:histidine phosphatase family protein [Elioraea sp.]
MLTRRLIIPLAGIAAVWPLAIRPAGAQRPDGPAVEGGASAREVDAGDVWEALRQGRAAAVMRHATAPGVSDPAGYRLDDCATQRNLSDEGRTQARAIGDAFRAHGVTEATVMSSAWCRARETAELLGLGDVRREPALDSFFNERMEGPARTAAVRALLAAWRDGPLVCVTHQVNITSLTSLFPAQGELMVVETGGSAEGVAGLSPRVLGRIRV